MTFERRFDMLRSFVAILIALCIAFALMLIFSDKPISSLYYFLVGPLTKVRYMGNVVEMAIPLIFSGLATSLLFQAGQFNMGSEGIIYFGGMLTGLAAIYFKLPPVLLPLVAILVAVVYGMFHMGTLGFLKAKLGVNELVSSLMTNSVVLGIGLYFLNYTFRDKQMMYLCTHLFQPQSILPRIIPMTRIHLGLVFALVALAVVHLFLYHTKWGYRVRMLGQNEQYVRYLGINTTKVILVVSVLAGALAGMGGAVETLGMYDRFQWAALPGLGFDGALIATLSKNKPLNVLPAALFLGYIRCGADIMGRQTTIPAEMVLILQGVIILLISGQRFLQAYRQRMLVKEVKASGSVSA